jgi:streptomycin 6-kinase
LWTEKNNRVDLPQDFILTIQNTYGRAGDRFLNSLPDFINEAASRWNLTGLQAVPNLSYNFVAFAKDGDRQVVLKIGVPCRELTSEITALRLFDGRGTARLLVADEPRGMFLLERLQPGRMLADFDDDEQAVHIAADVMLALWRAAPSGRNLIQLSDWFKGFKQLRDRFAGGTGPFNEELVGRAEGLVQELFAEDYAPMLIHGDLHHFNILTSGPGWLAIDPKGVIGPAAYEVGPLLLNPWKDLGDGTAILHMTQRRIAILSERLGFERERIRAWGLAHAVLSAWWSLEDNAGWEYAMNFAGLLARLGLN